MARYFPTNTFFFLYLRIATALQLNRCLEHLPFRLPLSANLLPRPSFCFPPAGVSSSPTNTMYVT